MLNHTCVLFMHRPNKHGNRKWRHNNPFMPFDRVSFNECWVVVIAQMEIDLAAELQNFTTRFEAWKKAGALPSLRPKCKQGNCITRSYEKTGWWPLKKNSELWQKAIETLGPLANPEKHKMSDKARFADVGDKRVRIRELVLESYQTDFIDRAAKAEKECKERM